MRTSMFLLVTIIFTSLLSCNYSNINSSEKIYVAEKFSNGYIAEVPSKENYRELCKWENENKITFPRVSAAIIYLHKNNKWSSKKRLTSLQSEKLLNILNDSVNYDWGEMGTPEIHYYFTFHNSNGECIGLTTIDFTGMAYSNPATAKMKWGFLNKMDQIENLISEIH